MSGHDNKDMVRKVRAQIARRHVDTSMLNVSVMGGSVYLSGVISIMRTNPGVDLRVEMQQITQILRSISGIRDVTWDVTQRT